MAGNKNSHQRRVYKRELKILRPWNDYDNFEKWKNIRDDQWTNIKFLIHELWMLQAMRRKKYGEIQMFHKPINAQTVNAYDTDLRAAQTDINVHRKKIQALPVCKDKEKLTMAVKNAQEWYNYVEKLIKAGGQLQEVDVNEGKDSDDETIDGEEFEGQTDVDDA